MTDAFADAWPNRCTRALWAIGQLRVPPAILTPRFKKLVADKQAEEAECPLVIRNPGVKLQATTDAELERLLAARKAEEDWAAMAEGQEIDEADLENRSGSQHLMLACRVLLMCSASRTDSVRQEAAALLAEADIPGALNALQVCLYVGAKAYLPGHIKCFKKEKTPQLL